MPGLKEKPGFASAATGATASPKPSCLYTPQLDAITVYAELCDRRPVPVVDIAALPSFGNMTAFDPSRFKAPAIDTRSAEYLFLTGQSGPVRETVRTGSVCSKSRAAL